MSNPEYVAMLNKGVDEWNKWREENPHIRPNLMDEDLWGRRLPGINLSGAMLTKANLTMVDLSRANLSRAILSGANLMDASLWEANLSGANLSYAHLIYTDLGGATVDDVNINEAVIHGLRGLPKPPNTLRDEYADFANARPFKTITRILTGREAADFFVRPEKVEVVLDRALTHEELAAYRVFVAECEANKQWPESVIYLEGYVEKGHTLMGFQAPKAEDIISNLPFLLQPFRNAAAIDWEKTLAGITEEEKDGLLTTALAKPEFRSRIAERLWQFEGFAKSRPEAIREAGKSYKVDVNPDAVRALPKGSNLVLQLNIVEKGDQHVGDNIIGGDNIGGAVGNGAQVKVRDITVYKQDVQNSGLDGETKEVLVRAIEKIGTLDLEDVFKQAVAEAVNQIRTELERPQRDAGKVKAIWQSIKRVAAPVATILQTAAAVKELIV